MSLKIKKSGNNDLDALSIVHCIESSHPMLILRISKYSIHPLMCLINFHLQVLPEYLSDWTTEKVRQENVDVRPNTSIKAAKVVNGRVLELTTATGEKVNVDHVIVAVGIDANTELAKTSGLEVDELRGGFRVNAELEARYEPEIHIFD